ncbi:hypothetical protein LJC71_02625 [Desulfosarcina sp. OttesenSCG-928-A07]|nr:hypothetical protein [Desulfosarcina sp. OttesenSCG-928-G17]MDL2328632.1 hypothetical protein [Desulfosarcina sp. OttesenSCG-928-A07]
MSKKKSKPATFDAMVKFFIQKYNLPTKRDIDLLGERLDRLEKMIRTRAAVKADSVQGRSRARRPAGKQGTAAPSSATEVVLSLIRQNKAPTSISTIRDRTGFDDKKLRNIIYRLNQMGKISRINRGSYRATA